MTLSPRWTRTGAGGRCFGWPRGTGAGPNGIVANLSHDMEQQMKTSIMPSLIAGAFALGASASALAGGEPVRACSDSLVKGTYGIQMQGTRPAPGGVTETVIGVVVRNYDGMGGVTQIDNLKGSVTGIVPDRFGTGTYHVRDDCTVVIDFQPAPGLLLQEKAVIVDNGKELRTITVLPAGVMVTAVHRKI